MTTQNIAVSEIASNPDFQLQRIFGVAEDGTVMKLKKVAVIDKETARIFSCYGDVSVPVTAELMEGLKCH